ncbi:hypothetical protein Tco_0117016 [Tanacetum coccineum]
MIVTPSTPKPTTTKPLYHQKPPLFFQVLESIAFGLRSSRHLDLHIYELDALYDSVRPLVWISQKSQENSQKRESTDTRIRRVQQEAKESKSKPEKSSLSQIQSNYGQ